MRRPYARTLAPVLRRVLDGLRGGLRRAPESGPAPEPPHHKVWHEPGEHPRPDKPGVAEVYGGPVRFAYAPQADGHPDPGEVVWTWVPFEEDDSRGKDRPVVVLGWAGDTADLAVAQLSSKDHPDDPRWMLVGSGGWDPEGRPSSVRLDRLLAVAPEAVRREGAALDRPRYDAVVTALSERRSG